MQLNKERARSVCSLHLYLVLCFTSPPITKKELSLLPWSTPRGTFSSLLISASFRWLSYKHPLRIINKWPKQKNRVHLWPHFSIHLQSQVHFYTFCFLFNPPHSGYGSYLVGEVTLPKVIGSLHLPNLVMDYEMDSFAFSSCTSTIHSAHTGHGNLFKNIKEIMSQSCLHTLQRLPITITVKLKHLSMAFKAFYDLACPACQSHLLLILPDTRRLHPLWPSSGS